MSDSSRPGAEPPVESRRDVLADILRVEEQLNDLRVLYEQFFVGAIKFLPEKEHAEVERGFRRLMKSPLRNSELNFRVRSLKYRFSTLATYWKRILREREEGRYHRDLFKAELHRKGRAESEFRSTKAGKADSQMQVLYRTWQDALSQAGMADADVPFSSFKGMLMSKAKELARTNPGKKVSFSVVLKGGQPSVEAKVRSEE